MSTLTFDQLREANIQRLPLYRNANGDIVHSKTDGSDWTPAEWFEALIGELGEYANIRKKFRRGDMSFTEFATLGGKELADAQVYLDLLAYQFRMDLGQITKEKFNEVSVRVGARVFIP